MLSDIYDIYAKGREYAEQYEKYMIWMTNDFILFVGKNSEHHVTHENDAWRCDCDTFARWQSHPNYPNFCPHVLAVEKVASLVIKTIIYDEVKS